MDTIWDRNPSKSEVIGRCGGDEQTKWPRRTDKSRTLTLGRKTHTVSKDRRMLLCRHTSYQRYVYILDWLVLNTQQQVLN